MSWLLLQDGCYGSLLHLELCSAEPHALEPQCSCPIVRSQGSPEQSAPGHSASSGDMLHFDILNYFNKDYIFTESLNDQIYLIYIYFFTYGKTAYSFFFNTRHHRLYEDKVLNLLTATECPKPNVTFSHARADDTVDGSKPLASSCFLWLGAV